MKSIYLLSTFCLLAFSVSCSKAGEDRRKTSGAGSSGLFDEQFYNNFGTGFNGTIHSLSYVGNEKILVGGDFTTFKGSSATRIAKISQSGEIDSAFRSQIGSGFNGSVRSVALASDGGLLVGGEFTSFNGTSVPRFVKLNQNGSIDSGFLANFSSGPNDRVNTIHVASDGSIYIGGAFTQVSSRSSSGIAKFSSNGTLSTTFSSMIGTGASEGVYAIKALSNSQVLVGGKFTSFNSSPAKGIVVLNSNGSTDGSFLSVMANAFNEAVYAIAEDSSSRFVFAGAFTAISTFSANRLLRTNADMSLPSIFTPSGNGFNAPVKALMIQSDKKIVLGGEFTTLSGQTRNYLVRLNDDLTLDDTFQAAIGSGPSGNVNALCSDSEGKIIVGGSFTSFNSNVVGYMVRLK